MVTFKGRFFGWKKEAPDFRDKVYKAIPCRLPASVDLTDKCSPVKDQGTLGSCTANSLAGILEFNEPKNTALIELSRLFIYYNERAYEGTVNEDAGAAIRDGIKMLAKYGVCAESIWPYLIARFKTKPDAKAYNDAKSRIIKTYQTMDTLFQMKSCLADGHPFSFGFTVYESFMSAAVAKTGIAPMPEPGESPVGGHAVYAIGYDDAKQFVKVRNSWGASWGDKGNFYLPYAYIGNKNLADDMWQVTK